MTRTKKTIAVCLALLLGAACALPVVAADGAGEPYSPAVRAVDAAFGAAQDALFGTLQAVTAQWNIPTVDKFLAAERPTFFGGTDGTVRGSGWRAGFASASVIPTKWRCDANGKSDPNGMCLKSLHATGGYQTFVSKLYTDQRMRMLMLSNGADTNKNGISDLIVFVSVDGVGMTAATVNEMRAGIMDAIGQQGVKLSDVLSCNISATHCHAGLDIQGMCIPTLFLNKLNPLTDYDRSLDREMQKTLVRQAGKCAAEAFAAMEPGSLYFFETDPVSGARDKLNSGVQPKNTFSCVLFEGTRGMKTILTNIGAHPTSYGAWNNKQLMCTDYPYFMEMALRDAGYNLVFTQSAEAAVSPPSIECAEGSAQYKRAEKWVEKYALTREEWVKNYGEKYTQKWYEDQADSLKWHMRNGYLLAHHVLNAVGRRQTIAPKVNARGAWTLLPFDDGVMAWGSISGLLGENVVRMRGAEALCGVMVETDLLALGDNVTMLTAPGELSAGMLLGSDPKYTGSAKWTGKTSWTGEEWQYDTITDLVRKASGNKKMNVMLLGITNDALGYIYPDVCTPKSLLGAALFYKEDESKNMTNCMLMTVGTKAGSALMDGYVDVVRAVFEGE